MASFSPYEEIGNMHKHVHSKSLSVKRYNAACKLLHEYRRRYYTHEYADEWYRVLPKESRKLLGTFYSTLMWNVDNECRSFFPEKNGDNEYNIMAVLALEGPNLFEVIKKSGFNPYEYIADKKHIDPLLRYYENVELDIAHFKLKSFVDNYITELKNYTNMLDNDPKINELVTITNNFIDFTNRNQEFLNEITDEIKNVVLEDIYDYDFTFDDDS